MFYNMRILDADAQVEDGSTNGLKHEALVAY